MKVSAEDIIETSIGITISNLRKFRYVVPVILFVLRRNNSTQHVLDLVIRNLHMQQRSFEQNGKIICLKNKGRQMAMWLDTQEHSNVVAFISRSDVHQQVS